MLDQAIEVMQAWGFIFKTAGTWLKTTKHGKISFGPGYILRSSNEPFLIGTVGRPVTTNAVRSGFAARVREHSRKPDHAYRMAEALIPNARRADLFSRQTRPGWESWGNESTKFDLDQIESLRQA
jgi:N6-adenosine-specific RNA methylase IME4